MKKAMEMTMKRISFPGSLCGVRPLLGGSSGCMLAALAALTLAACSGDEDEGSSEESCQPGSLQCTCKTDGSCNEGLTCEEGYCVPGECPEGSTGCPCYADGSCDEGASCAAGICEAEQEPGGPGDPCGVEHPCGTHEGTQLECVQGICRAPGCEPGTAGCTCTDQGECGEGLSCQQDVCVPATEGGMTVGNPDVRACDLLFEQAGLSVAFAESAVTGVSLREGERLAISFSARVDAPLDGSVGSLVLTGGSTEAPQPLTVQCWDRLGQAVAEPGLIVR